MSSPRVLQEQGHLWLSGSPGLMENRDPEAWQRDEKLRHHASPGDPHVTGCTKQVGHSCWDEQAFRGVASPQIWKALLCHNIILYRK